MNNEYYIQKIESNLYSLYEKMATFSGNLIWEREEIRWVDCQPQSWPKTIFGTPKGEVNFEDLIRDIRNGTIPPHWILQQKKDNGDFHRQLKAHGFRLMTQWPGMAIDLDGKDFQASDIITVSNSVELEEWVDVINQTLFVKNPLNKGVMQRCFESKELTYFYIQKENNKTVNACFCYDTNETAGLYMLGTLEAYRGKGYGDNMMRHMLWDAKKRGQKNATLQATAMGAKMYTRLGFETYSMFDVYWLLGQR